MISIFGRGTVYTGSRVSKSAFMDRNSASNFYRHFHKSVVCCARKPLWLPLAKSKMFKVPQKPLLPVDETEEIEYHSKNYETLMDSLVELQKGKDREAAAKQNIQMKSIEEEILEMFAKNEPINKLVAERRKEARELELEKMEEEILIVKEKKENRIMEMRQQRERFIESELERLETALKLEDLDEVIDKALSNVSDYNYAIDLKGNHYKGRYTTAPVNKSV